jgi:hypothetical protein
MLEFYEFNTLNICVVLSSTFIIYYMLNTINNNSEKENNDFNLEYLIISVLVSICISFGVSYFITGKDETILTENYWENSNLE